MADAEGPCQDTSMLSAAADAEDGVTDEKVPVTLEVCQASTSTATSEDIASRVRMYFSTRGLTYRDGPLSITPGTDPYLDKHVDAICMCDTEGAKATLGARLLSWQVDLSVYVHQLNDDDVAGTTACRGHTLSNLRLRSCEYLLTCGYSQHSTMHTWQASPVFSTTDVREIANKQPTEMQQPAHEIMCGAVGSAKGFCHKIAAQTPWRCRCNKRRDPFSVFQINLVQCRW